jgi:hypothetical protein
VVCFTLRFLLFHKILLLTRVIVSTAGPLAYAALAGMNSFYFARTDDFEEVRDFVTDMDKM